MTSSRDLFSIPEDLGPRLLGLSEDGSSSSNNNKNNKNADGFVVDDEDDSLAYVSPSLAISTDPNLVVHGRGLVASRPIKAGELLFVHPPSVKAELSQVLRIYKNKAGNGSGTRDGASSSSLLECIAETVLLKEMKRAVRGKKKERNARIAATFLALNSHHSTKNEEEVAESNTDMSGTNISTKDKKLLRVLMGKSDIDDAERVLEKCGEAIDDNDYLLGIIRHNAFGPDFHHYHRMERELSNNNKSVDSISYSRILGHYPLAAMINHTCGPTNATRVFYNETMVATATQAISAGKEICWPYCPPTAPFPVRSERLQNGYGFSCRMDRSVLEERAYGIGIPPPKIPPGFDSGFSGGDVDTQLDLQQWETLLRSLEVWYMVVAAKIQSPIASNKKGKDDTEDQIQQQRLLLQHGLRLGYTHLYIQYFNEALQYQAQNSNSESVQARILKEANKLHCAFSAVHNACTEHLSLLHLCYELSATTKARTDTTTAIRFWTEQLKEAHICRYSDEIVGRNLATLRTVLKHTRMVLRTKDGWKNYSNLGINSFI